MATDDEIPVRLACPCGTTTSYGLVTSGRAWWTCPGCGRGWRPDEAAARQVWRAVDDLRRLRFGMGVLLAAAGLTAVVLVVVHPGWVMLLPLVVGGATLIARPTYRRRTERVRAVLRAPIPLLARPDGRRGRPVPDGTAVSTQ
jgi:hypothetical protein